MGPLFQGVKVFFFHRNAEIFQELKISTYGELILRIRPAPEGEKLRLTREKCLAETSRKWLFWKLKKRDFKNFGKWSGIIKKKRLFYKVKKSDDCDFWMGWIHSKAQLKSGLDESISSFLASKSKSSKKSHKAQWISSNNSNKDSQFRANWKLKTRITINGYLYSPSFLQWLIALVIVKCNL